MSTYRKRKAKMVKVKGQIMISDAGRQRARKRIMNGPLRKKFRQKNQSETKPVF